MQKRLLTIAVAAVTGSFAFGTQAVAAEHGNENGQQNNQQQNEQRSAQGLYSANDLIGSDVYLESDPEEDVGDVEDILLDDQQKISSLVISTGEVLGLGGREIVADIKDISLETEHDESQEFGEGYVTHRIFIHAETEDLEGFPEYERTWFDEERERRRSDLIGPGTWQADGVPGGTMGNEE
ncbi:PRC-barrel domain-containing protein [Halomonas cerina]|uniref:Sporulation protein YlmC with PRC-barrel domain n=1 Tax=Halomonas cerina TaxID=447424 RepID=A0A839VDJ7_9GAMM|nr:PRC-barrel domain-containing protein [Halomonas cerina]MBB3190734.1 sporulation protein YlmC with PRC-barrel domain [Halomonas cerina]